MCSSRTASRGWGRRSRCSSISFARANGEVRVRIPGSWRAFVEVALVAALRLAPVLGLLLLSERVEPPTALAIAGYMVF